MQSSLKLEQVVREHFSRNILINNEGDVIMWVFPGLWVICFSQIVGKLQNVDWKTAGQILCFWKGTKVNPFQTHSKKTPLRSPIRNLYIWKLISSLFATTWGNLKYSEICNIQTIWSTVRVNLLVKVISFILSNGEFGMKMQLVLALCVSKCIV